MKRISECPQRQLLLTVRGAFFQDFLYIFIIYYMNVYIHSFVSLYKWGYFIEIIL